MVTLFGALVGFLGSIVPEFLKMWKDSSDKKHELQVMKLQMDFQAQGHRDRLEEISFAGDIAQSQALYKTYHTGIGWVDALNGTVRPVVAYAFFLLYAAIKFLYYASLPDSGVPFVVVYEALWTTEDAAIFAGIMSFYFGQRAMHKLRVGR
ncbi:MAG: hypothetical protein K0R63_955 [Rickettsiales bacterium]|jgi:hypothetical protein|nr:hypothetical protein [Rickettsiales bacterium]